MLLNVRLYLILPLGFQGLKSSFNAGIDSERVCYVPGTTLVINSTTLPRPFEDLTIFWYLELSWDFKKWRCEEMKGAEEIQK